MPLNPELQSLLETLDENQQGEILKAVAPMRKAGQP